MFRNNSQEDKDMAKYERENYWLSNFFPADIYIYTVDTNTKILCNCVETAFQALLAQDNSERLKISQMHPLEAKKYAYNNRLPMRTDALKVMKQLLHQKFKQHTLKKQLMECPDNMFVHENGWHDNFWGHCTCGTNRCLGRPKHNHLGKLLKQLKYEFIREENRIKDIKKVEPASPAKEEEVKLTGTDDLAEQITGQKEEEQPKPKKKIARKAKTKKEK